jgi:hypothetical protein
MFDEVLRKLKIFDTNLNKIITDDSYQSEYFSADDRNSFISM